MKKHLENPKIRITIVCILGLLILALIYRGLFGSVVKRRQFLKQQYDQLQKELDYAKKENIKLKTSGSSQTYEEYLEKESRLSLGMKKEGETVVVLQEGTTTSTTISNINDISKSVNSIFNFFKKLFK